VLRIVAVAACFLAVPFSRESAAQEKLAAEKGAKTVSEKVGDVRWLKGYEDVVWSVAFSPDGSRTLSTGGLNQLCDAAADAQIRRFGDGGWFAVFSPTGDQVLTGERTVQAAILWDTNSGRKLGQFPGGRGRVRYGVFSPDGKRIAINSWDSVVVSDIATHAVLAIAPAKFECLRGAVFSPDGKQLFIAQEDKTIRAFSTAAWLETAKWPAHAQDLCCLEISPDGRTLLTATYDPTEYDVFVWDVAKGTLQRTLHGGTGKPGAGVVAFSPAGGRALYASSDGMMILWDVDAGKEIQRWKQDAAIVSVAISPDGKHALCGAADKKAFMMRLPDPPLKTP
jgi:WD40 repeat protein